ncbi:cytochrome P450 [Corynespora cassiicola Philippines]|uniref:Cytochrome P450 n=1 Tax=Corynespora cassiicola Philippines TaxID=1448308 RepID=A0A2T2NAS6_CORCC|nr:cytochrome P450 [Corynespora cassiicola Philippines]
MSLHVFDFNWEALFTDRNIYLSISTCVCAFLVTWRIWRFTVCPVLWPKEPKELPYWIPFLGHVGGFFMDFNTAIDGGLKHFKNREPFTMNIAGTSIYIISDAQDAAVVWKNSSTITMDPLSVKLYIWVGMSAKSREVLFQAHQDAKYNEGNAKPLTPQQMMIQLHHRQSHPGARLDYHIEESTLPSMFRNLDLKAKQHPAVLGRSGKGTRVSLLKLCTHIFIKGQTDAYFGQAIWWADPHLMDYFMVWEHTNWKYLFEMPSFMSGDMLQAKGNLIQGFTKYLAIPREERKDASYFVQTVEDMLREVGLTESEIGSMLMLHYWAIIGNVYKIAFWLVTYMVQRPELLEAVRREVTAAVGDDRLDENYLTEKCPNLEVLFNETLRLTVTSPLGRVVTGPTNINGKVLQEGNMLMVIFRELHFNSAIWGEEAQSFRAQRFLDNPKLLRNPSFRPWGGGNNMCPGRFLAKRSIYAFVAILLSKYHIGIEEHASIPKGDSTKPSPGVMPIAEGEDLLLNVTVA